MSQIKQQNNPINLKSSKLNVGCGRNIKDGWINLDIAPLEGVDVVADLDDCNTTPIPLPDNAIEEFLLSHVIEHIRNPLPLMQELYRIAKPGAKMVIRVPYGSSDDAFEDPTHVQQYFVGSFGYFAQPYYWRADYGYRGDWLTKETHLMVEKQQHAGKAPQQIFEEIKKYRNIVTEMIVVLEAIKPARQPDRSLQTSSNIKIGLV